MADTANLELNVKSNASQATKDLNALDAAANKVARTSGALEAAAKRAGISVSEMQKRVDNAGTLVANAGKKVQSAAPPTQLLQQRMDKASSSATNLANTLTRRFVTGILITQIRNLTEAFVHLNAEIARTGDVAVRTGTSGADTQGLIGSAQNKGVDPTQFLDAYSKLGQQVELARHGAGDLLVLFQQTNSTLGTTQEAFLRIADLVASARTETAKINILQAAGLPTTEQFIRLMEQGASAIRGQAGEFSKLNDQQLKAAKELNDKFAEIGGILERGFKRGVVAAYDFFKRAQAASDGYIAALSHQKPILQTGAEDTGLDMAKTPDQIVAAANKRSSDQAAAKAFAFAKIDNTQIQQQISLLGNLANADQAVALKRAELNLAVLGG